MLHKRILVGVSVILVLLAGVVGFNTFTAMAREKEDAEFRVLNGRARMEASLNELNIVTGIIEDRLNSVSSTPKVYGADGKLMFVSAGESFSERDLTSQMQTMFYEYILLNCNVLNEEAWFNSLREGSNQTFESSVLSSTLSGKALSIVCTYSGILVKQEHMVPIALELSRTFTESELMTYCLGAMECGGFKGFHEASAQLFGKELHKLSAIQLEYLFYIASNEEYSFDSFIQLCDGLPSGTTQESMGFRDTNDTLYRGIEEGVRTELLSYKVPVSKSVNVGTKIDSRMQNALQSNVDTLMRSHIELLDAGRTLWDATVVVFENNTGSIIADVVSRSVNRTSSRLSLPTPCEASVYTSIAEAAEKNGYHYNSLVASDDGTRVLSIREAISSGNLKWVDEGNSVAGNSTSVSDLLIFAGASVGVEPHYTTGVEVDGASTPAEVHKDSGNMFTVNLLRNAEDSWYFEQKTRQGVSFVFGCKDWTAVGIVGVSAIGMNLDDSGVAECSGIASSIAESLETNFTSIGALETVGDEITDVFVENEKLVTSVYMPRIENLGQCTIASGKDVKAWESEYFNITSDFSKLKTFVSNDFYDEWQTMLGEVRNSRTFELIKFS